MNDMSLSGFWICRACGDPHTWLVNKCGCGALYQPFDLQAAEPTLAQMWNGAIWRLSDYMLDATDTPGTDSAGWPLRDGPEAL